MISDFDIVGFTPQTYLFDMTLCQSEYAFNAYTSGCIENMLRCCVRVANLKLSYKVHLHITMHHSRNRGYFSLL